MLNLVVGDTNSAGLALGKLGHSWLVLVDASIDRKHTVLTLPSVDNGDTIVDNHITTLDRAALDQGEVRFALLESDGPVNKVQVQVFELKLSKASIERSLNDLRAVLAVPQLRGNKQVLTLEAGNILVGTLDSIGNLTLVLVDSSQIQVTVAGLQGLVNSLADLARGRLPGAESQLAASGLVYNCGWIDRRYVRDLGASVESDLLSERHCVW